MFFIWNRVVEYGRTLFSYYNSDAHSCVAYFALETFDISPPQNKNYHAPLPDFSLPRNWPTNKKLHFYTLRLKDPLLNSRS